MKLERIMPQILTLFISKQKNICFLMTYFQGTSYNPFYSILHIIRIVNCTNLVFFYVVVAYFVLFLCLRAASDKFVYEVIVQDSLAD